MGSRVLITEPWYYGYFCADRFDRTDGQVADEIALNPSHFRNRPVMEVLGTLAHEMVHLWQHHHGKPGRGRYHNREWAAFMKRIGLQPTSTGEEGGKETGDRVAGTWTVSFLSLKVIRC
jgi:hypothetical protein